MRTTSRVLILAILVGGAAAMLPMHAAQQPGAGGSRPSLAGTVVDRSTGAPVAGAQLSLARCSPPSDVLPRMWPFAEAGSCVTSRSSRQAQADRDGRFAFEVDPGRYTLSVEAPGYVRQEYGQRTFPGTGLPIVVEADAGLRELPFAVTRAASVRGRVYDSLQRPLIGVPVELLRPTYSPLGDRFYEIVGQAATGDRGEYEVSSLPPGEYLLAAGTRAWTGEPATAGEPAGYPHAYVYYPGVADLAAASRVTVAPGAVAAGIDVVVSGERHRISGHVRRAGGARLSRNGIVEVVALRPDVRPWRARVLSTAVTLEDGAFEVADLSAGRYLVRASDGGSIASAPIDVTIADEDAVGIELILADGARASPVIDGRWRVDSARTRPSRHDLSPCEEGVRVLLVRSALQWPVFVGEGIEAESPWLQEDGTFAFRAQPPGEYRLHLHCPSADVFLKEAYLDGADVLGRRFALQPSRSHVLEVVFSREAGAVDVTVTSTFGSVRGTRVVLAPAERDRLDLFQSGLVDDEGRIRFASVAPGSYDVFAWPALEAYAYFDPAVLERADAWAPATVRASSAAAVRLQLTSAR